MPDLRELVSAVVDAGVMRLASSSGVAERGSVSDVTPDRRCVDMA